MAINTASAGDTNGSNPMRPIPLRLRSLVSDVSDVSDGGEDQQTLTGVSLIDGRRDGRASGRYINNCITVVVEVRHSIYVQQ